MIVHILTAIFIMLAGIAVSAVLYGMGFSTLVALNAGVLAILVIIGSLRALDKPVHGGIGKSSDPW